ncbi:MAG: isopentenyl-diphosphate delta-isomerase, partial [Lachnospiraceae bacterium]|nr:isopentenyl-diphosphate delta-isomerase [Lachnospiraceae bacterium]
IQMDSYRPLDITEAAKAAAAEYPLNVHDNGHIKPNLPARVPRLTKRFDTDGRIKTKTLGTDGFMIDHETVELRYVEQLTESGQLSALSRALLYAMKHYFNGKKDIREIVAELSGIIEKRGVDGLCEGAYVAEGLSFVRPQELFACFNRCRFINFR